MGFPFVDKEMGGDLYFSNEIVDILPCFLVRLESSISISPLRSRDFNIDVDIDRLLRSYRITSPLSWFRG